jgi:hypothetical protein
LPENKTTHVRRVAVTVGRQNFAFRLLPYLCAFPRPPIAATHSHRRTHGHGCGHSLIGMDRGNHLCDATLVRPRLSIRCVRTFERLWPHPIGENSQLTEIAATPFHSAGHQHWLPLDGHSHGISSTKAERCNAFVHVATYHFVQQRHQHPSAAGADRMAQRDSAAIHIDLV